MSHQMTLPLSYKPSYHPSDFIVGGANRAAYNWVLKWPHWSSYGLVIWGENKCGKRHLSSIWQGLSAAIPARFDDGHLGGRLALGNTFIFDSFLNKGQTITTAQSETLFHFLNSVREQGGFVLITSNHPPRHWSIPLPDLKSRMMALDSCTIGAPDDDVLIPLLMKLFSDVQITLSGDLLAYTAARITRSYGAIYAFVDRCYKLTLETQKPLSFKGIRDILGTEECPI